MLNNLYMTLDSHLQEKMILTLGAGGIDFYKLQVMVIKQRLFWGFYLPVKFLFTLELF